MKFSPPAIYQHTLLIQVRRSDSSNQSGASNENGSFPLPSAPSTDNGPTSENLANPVGISASTLALLTNLSSNSSFASDQGTGAENSNDLNSPSTDSSTSVNDASAGGSLSELESDLETMIPELTSSAASNSSDLAPSTNAPTCS